MKRRFTSWLTLLLLILGTSLNTLAQSVTSYTFNKVTAIGSVVTSADNLTDNGLYLLKNRGRNKYISVRLGSYGLSTESAVSVNDEISGRAVFKLHITTATDGSKTYSFESASCSGYYIPAVTNGGSGGNDLLLEQTTTPATYTIQTTDADGNALTANNFILKSTSKNGYFDCEDTRFCGWQGKGNNSNYQFIPVTVDENTPLTFRSVSWTTTDGTNTIASLSGTGWKKDGTSIYNNPVHSFYYTWTQPDGDANIIGADHTTFNYSIVLNESQRPFKPDTYYNFKTRAASETNKFITASGTAVTAYTEFTETGITTWPTFVGSLWKFVEVNVFGGLKIYNVGTGKYLNMSGNQKNATVDANGVTLYMKEPYASAPAGAQFRLTDEAGTTYVGNHAGWDQTLKLNTSIGFWTGSGCPSDPGSQFTIKEINANEDLLNIGKAALSKMLNNPVVASDNYLTAGTDAEAIAKAKQSLEAITDNTVDKMNDIYEQVFRRGYPDYNAYYRLYSCTQQGTSNYLYASTASVSVSTEGVVTNDDTNYPRIATRIYDGNQPSALWKFADAGNGKVYILNANTSTPLGQLQNATQSQLTILTKQAYDDGYAGKYEIRIPLAASSNTQFNLIESSHYLNSHGGQGSTALGCWDADGATGTSNQWKIERVTTLPLTISTAGYASATYPFAVQLPEGSSVKAYYAAAADNNELTLREFPNGIIPANQGAIFALDGGGTETLTIITDATNEQTTIDNKFSGATAERKGFESESTYVLGVDDDQTVKFLKNGMQLIPANKAYLLSSQITNSGSALHFVFNNPTTGINSTKTTLPSHHVYYDLHGRVVAFPTHGIFVKDNGEKVFIK